MAMEKQHIKISVRNMVEFVSRSGNIDSRYVSAARAQEGIRIHKKIQKMRKKKALLEGFLYESEFTLKHGFSYKDCTFQIEGRADGILVGDDLIAVEEIKSTTRDIDDIQEDRNHWHWAQAKCYGYIYCLQTDSPRAKLMLTYCNVESEAHRSFEHVYIFEELEAFFFQTVEKYYVYAKLDLERIKDRNATVKSLAFPFAGYRRGQRELAVSVYGTILKGKGLFAQAPTGTGKTVSVLFPSVKALGEGLINKIFYITAKTTTRAMAEGCARLMEEKGLKMRSVTLTAKEKICPNEKKKACNPVDCPLALGHFDRVNEGIVDIIENETRITKELVAAYAIKHQVCPYEFSLDITNFCDLVICDYNYVYDPVAKLRRYFSDGEKNEFAILVDEAHNLVDRAREMFSAQLEKKDVLSLRRKFQRGTKIYKSLSKINKNMLELSRQYTTEEKTTLLKELPQLFLRCLLDFAAEADRWLASKEGGEGDQNHEALLEFYFQILDFTRIMELYDQRFITLIQEGPGNVAIRLLCLDPSYLLSLSHKSVTANIFFSATLMPLPFFQDVLGGEEGDYTLKLLSPFPQERFCLLVNNAVSTKYKDREKTYEAVADMIYYGTSPKQGNYMVFFPSYAYLDAVYALFSEKYPQVDTTLQQQGQAQDTSGFLEQFSEDNEKTLVGFAVLGGAYSEGIDLYGDKLIGAIIVGVGLPLISPERDVIKDYYMEKQGNGFEYAYMYPGMNKVLQAAGRVIRKEDDKGMVLLIDSRFLNTGYRQIFPEEWRHFRRVSTPESLLQALSVFWEGQ